MPTHRPAPQPRPDRPGRRGQPSEHDTGTRTDADPLAQTLARVARELQDESSLEDTVHGVVVAAVDTIPGAEFGGITEVRRRGEKVDVRYASDQLVVDVDSAQYELRQGPCLDAAYERRTIRVDDLSAEERWPDFARHARDLGVGSMLCFQLYVERGDLGALNLFSRRPRAFDDESEHVGLLFASHAAVAMAGAKLEDQLREGMSSRDLIGQAKGILMERYKITAEQAFLVLTRVSQQHNIKLRVLAERLAATGDMPQLRDGSRHAS